MNCDDTPEEKLARTIRQRDDYRDTVDQLRAQLAQRTKALEVLIGEMVRCGATFWALKIRDILADLPDAPEGKP